MPTVGIDHIAMPTANAERLIEFYKRLGFTINDEAAWRAGEANIFSIQMGDSKINVHPEGYTASLRGPSAVPGCTDICFGWEGSVEACQKMLADAGVTVIEGPGPRRGARGGGGSQECPEDAGFLCHGGDGVRFGQHDPIDHMDDPVRSPDVRGRHGSLVDPDRAVTPIDRESLPVECRRRPEVASLSGAHSTGHDMVLQDGHELVPVFGLEQ